MAPRTQHVTHGESHTIFTSTLSPSNGVSLHFTTEPLLFCCLPIFSLLEPFKLFAIGKQDFNRL